MAETVLSPGVYLNENDQSFVTQGVVSTGAVIVGPTNKGAAFVPTIVRSTSEFQNKFGNSLQYNKTVTYTPQTVDAYLNSAGSVMVVRVLGGGGFKFNSTRKLVGLIDSCSGDLLTVLYPGLNTEDLGLGESFTTPEPGFAESYKICVLDASDTGSLIFNNNSYSASFYVEQSNGTEQQYTFVFSGSAGFSGTPPAGTISASVADGDSAATMATAIFNSFTALGTDFSASFTLDGSGCITFTNDNTGSVTDIAGGWNTTSASVTVVSQGGDNNVANISEDFLLTLSGSNFAAQSFSASLNPNSSNYIAGNALGTAPNVTLPSNSPTGDNAFAYLNFRQRQTALLSGDCEVLIVTSSGNVEFTGSTAEGYDHGRTPWITSGNSAKNLFKFHHRGDGFDTNNDVYISITDLREPADVNGIEQYSSFTVLVRKVGDDEQTNTVLESYTGCNLNPESPKFIGRAIGDRYEEYNVSLGKVLTNGDYANASQFIRVEVSDDVKTGALSPKLSPRGHGRYYDVGGFAPTHNLPSASLQKEKVFNGSYTPNVFLGFDITNPDNFNYLKPVPKVGGSYRNGSNDVFNIDVLSGHPSASWVGSLSASVDTAGSTGPTGRQLQFNAMMQFGNDGIDYQDFRYVGTNITSTNVFGMDLSSTSTAGGQAYKKATDILSNKDRYDFNIIATPGVINNIHSAVNNQTLNMVEERADAIFVMDLEEENASVADAKNETAGLDSSYAAVYYPWVQMLNVDNGTPEYFPPSVVIPSVYQRNDNIAAPWFAPAGLTRGGIPGVIQAKNPLTKTERDILYNERVNPIATFPNQGVVVFGQKTLQRAASALDRVNVRRLLINLKKFVDAQSRFLVFEQNSAATRQRFLNLVNPYLQSIQDRQGVYAYRVQMDDSNNTPDVIDRNELVGAIYIQPTKTAEFIMIDFNIQATGAQI
jgi:hypothetical protein